MLGPLTVTEMTENTAEVVTYDRQHSFSFYSHTPSLVAETEATNIWPAMIQAYVEGGAL